MRHATLVAAAFAAVVSLHAAEITLPLTPVSISAWSLSGAEDSEVGHDPFVLPANAHLARSFAAERIAVTVESRPRFAFEPEHWQVLEIGAAAVVLAREGNTGLLALASGPEVVLHPHVIALLPDGTAAQPATLTFFKGGDVASLLVGGLRVDLKEASSVEGSFDVVLSTGAGSWSIDRLSVTLSVPGDSLPEHLAAEGAASEQYLRSLMETARSKRGDSGERVGANADREVSLAEIARAAADYRPLEVYTPPIVRSKRGEQVKAVIQALRNKK